MVILNATAAAQLFPSGKALGKRLRIGGGADAPYRTVVGIVGSTRHRSLDGATELQAYIPTTQWGEESGLTLIVHTNVRSSTVVPPLRAALRGVTRDLAINNVATLERLVNTSTADRRFAFVLFSCFAAVALVLAAAGLFGVLSAAVLERTREIGVRSALGATSERILGMVVRQGMPAWRAARVDPMVALRET